MSRHTQNTVYVELPPKTPSEVARERKLREQSRREREEHLKQLIAEFDRVLEVVE